MKTSRPTSGYALATVLMFSLLLSLMAAVLLRYAGSEFRLNQRNQLRFQAKNAAEGMLEYGSAEIMTRLQKNLNFSTGELRAYPLTAQNRKSTLYTTGSTTYNNVAPSGLRFWASQYTESTRRYIDPADPGNAYDPLRGQNVRTQTLRFLASAQSSAPGLSETQYATQSIEIRDAFLFNYAIFYNISMEFHPGATMTVSGPVHSNVDTHMTTDSSLKFLQSFSTAGKFTTDAIAAGRSSNPNIWFTNGLDQNLDSTPDTIAVNDATIKNAAGTTIPSGGYVDSNLASRWSGNSFAQMASQIWRGNVQDSSMGIVAQNLPAITAGDSATAHTLIEPPNTAGNATLEAQKYSTKAGLYIVQEANSTGTPPAPVAFANATDAAAYKATATGSRAAWRTTNAAKIITLPPSVINNTRRMYDFREAKWVSTVDIDLGKLRTAVNTTTNGAATNLKNSDGTDWVSASSTGGWNGQVYVDIETPTTGYSNATNSDAHTYNTSGVDTGSTMGTGQATTRTAVRLINGASVPNRKSASGVATDPDGFTLATNAPVYILGNLNSPGADTGTRSGTAVATTESAASVSRAKDNESPVAIAADAINVLSNAWWDSSLGKPKGDSSSSSSTHPAASKTEIAAAFLTGNVATSGSGGSSYSGGVENFPRLHENWGSVRLRYRGSMVALFNSTVATGPWSSARYDAATREWGFSDMFQGGRQPPGTPMVRTFRRVTYGDLTTAQFNTLLNNTTLGFTSM